jgi:hypothetical protein
VTVCIYCGHIMVYGEGLTLRDPTPAEMAEVAGDRRILMVQKMRQNFEKMMRDKQ